MIDLIESFYNLKADPFRLTSDYHFAYLHPGYRKALAYLKFAAYREEGFVMVTGKPGTGKTTLINKVLADFDPNEVLTAVLVTTQLEAHDLLHMVTSLFQIAVPDKSKSSLLLGIEQFLKNKRAEGRRVILIIDEAQGLRKDAVEELRLLSNLVADGRPLLQMFLVGQEELKDLVSSPELEQLRQRIVAAAHLDVLPEDVVFDYVRFRLSVAGWQGDPKIENAVVRRVAYYSGGVPRIINLIFSRLMLHGCIEERHTLDKSDMDAVIGELKEELLVSIKLNSMADEVFALEDEPEGLLQPFREPGSEAAPEPEPEPAHEPVHEPVPEAPDHSDEQVSETPAVDDQTVKTDEPAVDEPVPVYTLEAEDELIASLIVEPDSTPPAKPVVEVKQEQDDVLVIEPDGACHGETKAKGEELAPSLIAESKGARKPAAASRPRLRRPAAPVPETPPAEVEASSGKLALYIIGILIVVLAIVFLGSAVLQGRAGKAWISGMSKDAVMRVTPDAMHTQPEGLPAGRTGTILR